MHDLEHTWHAFLASPLHDLLHAPWADDPAFAMIAAHAGLRDSLGGPVQPALNMARAWVQARCGLDLLEVVRRRRPAIGLCLGFGMNTLEAYDFLQTLGLDCVHAYEWIAEHVVEAAQTLQALRAEMPCLPCRVRLHHGTISDLRAMAEASVQAIYTANVFTWEVPMTQLTFERAIQEIQRVLAPGGVVFSRGSAGVLEEHLTPYGQWLWRHDLVSVFQKQTA